MYLAVALTLNQNHIHFETLAGVSVFISSHIQHKFSKLVLPA